MKRLQNIASLRWWKQFVAKRRITITDIRNSSSEWHFHTSGANSLLAMLAVVMVIFIFTLSLVAYTPALEFLPGYRTQADKTRESLRYNIMRLDSIEQIMSDMLTYNENILLVMDGKTPVARTITNADSTAKTLILTMPSREDSLLRAQMEGEGLYSLGSTSPSKGDVRRMLDKVKPIEGVVTRKFDTESRNFGVEITIDKPSQVSSIDAGTVVTDVWSPEEGYVIAIQHDKNLISLYKNISQPSVTIGQKVKAGELIGTIKLPVIEPNSDEKAEAQLRLELWENGKPVDPQKYIILQ